jgi:hypothetical protein
MPGRIAITAFSCSFQLKTALFLSTVILLPNNPLNKRFLQFRASPALFRVQVGAFASKANGAFCYSLGLKTGNIMVE